MMSGRTGTKNRTNPNKNRTNPTVLQADVRPSSGGHRVPSLLHPPILPAPAEPWLFLLPMELPGALHSAPGTDLSHCQCLHDHLPQPGEIFLGGSPSLPAQQQVSHDRSLIKLIIFCLQLAALISRPFSPRTCLRPNLHCSQLFPITNHHQNKNNTSCEQHSRGSG